MSDPIRCAYCRATHADMAELEACAHRRIAWEAIEAARDREADEYLKRWIHYECIGEYRYARF